jgi:hypothetical protein
MARWTWKVGRIARARIVIFGRCEMGWSTVGDLHATPRLYILADDESGKSEFALTSPLTESLALDWWQSSHVTLPWPKETRLSDHPTITPLLPFAIGSIIQKLKLDFTCSFKRHRYYG